MAKKIRSEFVKGWGKGSGNGGGKKLDTNLDPLHSETDPLAVEPLSVETIPLSGDTSIAEGDLTAVEPLSVTTDKLDYAPGETALFTVTGVTEGGAVTFDLADDPDDPGDDGDADIYPSFTIVDGGALDLDGVADGSITAAWLVPTNGDPNNATLNLTVTDWGADGVLGGGDDRTATATFTDAAISYEQWETITGDWAGGQANSNQTGFVEGDVTPHRVLLTDLEPDTTYGIVVRFDYYQSNTNAGGRLYLDDYNATIDGDGDPDFPLPGTLSTDGVYTFAANDPAGGSYVSPELTFYIGDPDSDGEIIDIENLSYRIIEDPPTGSTFREAEIIFTTDDDYIGTTEADLYFGLRLAQPGEAYEPVNGQVVDGASGFAGGGLQTRIQGSGSDAGAINQDPTINWISPSGNTAIQPGAVQPANPSILLDKTGTLDLGADGVATPGDVITYTLTVTNTGDVTLTDVTLTDPGLDSIGPLSDVGGDGVTVLAPEAVETATGTYAIAQADIDAGKYDNLATVSSEAPGGDPADDADDITDTDPHSEPIPQDPLIEIVKSGTLNDDDGTPGVSEGDTIDYAFTVTNTGNVTLTNVTVTDPLFTVNGVPIASLAPGDSDSGTFSGTYAITQDDIDAGMRDNTATATGTEPGGEPVTDTGEESIPLSQDPLIEIVKSGTLNDDDGTPGVSEGDTIDYAFTVTNTGNVTLTNVTVTDPLFTVNGVPIASLAPGDSDSGTFSGTYAITQDDIDAGMRDNTATATGTEPGGEPVTDTGEESIPLSQDPLIEIVKSGTLNDDDGTPGVSEGDTIDYAFTVTNTGNVTLTNVTVTDPLFTVNGVPIASLAPGDSDSGTFSGTYAITQDDIDAGMRDNTATATGTEPGGEPVTDTGEESIPLSQDPLIEIVKSGTLNDDDGTPGVSEGDTIDYAFTVTNTGNVTLTNVTVTDPLFTVNGVPIASLAPGDSDSGTFSGTYAITQDDIDAGMRDNTATATGTEPGGEPVTDTGEESIPLSQDPLIEIVKSGTLNDDDGTPGVSEGDTIDYAFTVTNTGNVTLTNVTVTDPLFTVNGVPIASLAPGDSDSGTFSGTYAITQDDIDAGMRDNTATATGTEPGGEPVTDTGEESIPLSQDPLIEIVKSGTLNDDDGTPGVSEGDTIDYAFTVTNTGNVTLTNVTVTDPLFTVNGVPIASLAPGDSDSGTFSGTYAITQDDIDAGMRDNTATATGTEPGGEPVTDTGEESIPLSQDPLIEIVKSGTLNDDDGTPGVSEGDTIDYAFTVTNTGNVTLTNVTVTDPLFTVNGVPIASLAPGDSDSGTFSGTYAITQDDIDAGMRDNTATATGTEPGGEPVTDTGEESIPLSQDPLIEIVKSGTLNDDDGTPGVSEGDTIDYAFTVTNTGNVTLTNVTVTDPLFTVNGVPIASLAPGDSDSGTFSGTYAITQDDIDAGMRDNTATATGTEPGGEPVTDTGEESIPLSQDPLIEIVKTNGGVVDNDGNGPDAGDQIFYDYDVTNDGNVTLFDVSLTDDKLGPITLNGLTDEDGDGTADDLAVGAMAEGTATATLTQDDINAGSVTNIATAMGADPNEGLVEDDDTNTVTITQDPSLSFDKVIVDVAGGGPGGSVSQVGDIITYNFVVENTGDVDLTNVVVADYFENEGPVQVANRISGGNGDNVLDVGETWTYQLQRTVTQSDLDGARQIHSEVQKVGWLWCVTQECKGDLDLDNYAYVSAQAGEEVLNDADYAAVNVTCPTGCIDGNGSSNGGSNAEGLWQAWLDAPAQEALA